MCVRNDLPATNLRTLTRHRPKSADTGIGFNHVCNCIAPHVPCGVALEHWGCWSKSDRGRRGLPGFVSDLITCDGGTWPKGQSSRLHNPGRRSSKVFASVCPAPTRGTSSTVQSSKYPGAWAASTPASRPSPSSTPETPKLPGPFALSLVHCAALCPFSLQLWGLSRRYSVPCLCPGSSLFVFPWAFRRQRPLPSRRRRALPPRDATSRRSSSDEIYAAFAPQSLMAVFTFGYASCQSE